MQMEEHFLKDFVDGLEMSETFLAEPWYNKYGDCVIYQTVDEAVVADRVDDLLTIYRSEIDNRAIGFQLKDVLALAKKSGADAVQVETSTEEGADGNVKRIEIELTYLLLAAYEELPATTNRREAYAKVLSEKTRFELTCLLLAAYEDLPTTVDRRHTYADVLSEKLPSRPVVLDLVY